MAKLLKYDFLALVRVLLPVQLILIGVCVVSTPMMSFVFRAAEYDFHGYSYIFVLLPLMLLAAAILFASFVMTMFFIGRHFYQSIFSRQGYLTMCLPVTASAHLLSKVISGMFWMLLNQLCMLLSVGILMIFGTADDGLVSVAVIESVYESLIETIAGGGVPMLFGYLAQSFVTSVSLLLCIYFGIALGCMVAKRQKAALSVVFILAALLATYIIGLLSTVILALSTSIDLFATGSGPSLGDRYVYDSALVQSAIQVGLNAIYIAVYYPIAHFAIARKLNLE